MKRGYDLLLIRNKVLDAQRQKRKLLLNRERREKDYKPTLNITYHPAFQNLSSLLRKIHIILACNNDHQKVFQDIPTVGFRRGKSLEDFLVCAKVPPLGDNRSSSGGCLGKRCGVCTNVTNTTEFAGKGVKPTTLEIFILIVTLLMLWYLLACKTCGINYVGSCTTKFRAQQLQVL